MFAVPHIADPNPQPGQPAHPAQGAAPSTSAHLLSLVHILIAFGRNLARTLVSHPSAQTLHAFTRVFGTRDIAAIINRIIRGLRLAEALEQRLIRTARQIDNPRIRLAIPRAPRQQDPAATKPPAEPDLPSLPTVEEIAEQIRRRPIGAVLADICRDLGITTAHPAWSQIFLAVGIHRGNVVRLLQDMVHRIGAPLLLEAPSHQPPDTPFGPTPATGPP